VYKSVENNSFSLTNFVDISRYAPKKSTRHKRGSWVTVYANKGSKTQLTINLSKDLMRESGLKVDHLVSVLMNGRNFAIRANGDRKVIKNGSQGTIVAPPVYIVGKKVIVEPKIKDGIIYFSLPVGVLPNIKYLNAV
jgi:hypothetical protein